MMFKFRRAYQYILSHTGDLRFFIFTKFRKHKIPNQPMFASEAIDYIVKSVSNKRLLEYGSGGSTNYFSKFAKSVISVESDKQFAKKVSKQCSTSTNIEVLYSNIGPTKSFGQPFKMLRLFTKSRYVQYCQTPWEKAGGEFDVILIDGRFRVACAMVSLLNNNCKFLLIVDDYADRPEYSVISEVLNMEPHLIGSTAFFQIVETSNRNGYQTIYKKYKFDPA